MWKREQAWGSPLFDTIASQRHQIFKREARVLEKESPFICNESSLLEFRLHVQGSKELVGTSRFSCIYIKTAMCRL
jgi:hypothetical protein